MTRPVLVIFTKAPIAGRVKTRLGLELGVGRATALFRVLTKQTLLRVRSLTVRRKLDVFIAVSRHNELNGFNNIWDPSIPRFVQERGDLGNRMMAIAQQFPNSPLVIIGTDAPEVCGRDIVKAITQLQGHDVVLGPANDGGFWLIGLAQRQKIAGLFSDIRWSTSRTLDDLEANVPPHLKIGYLQRLFDVDEVKDLERVNFCASTNSRRTLQDAK